MSLILITARPEFWAPLRPDLQKFGHTTHTVAHQGEAAELLRADAQKDIGWVISDLPHNFASLSAVARQLLALRHDLRLAATSSFSRNDFAEAAAGLRLFPLPTSPTADDLSRFLNAPRQPEHVGS